MGNTHDCVAGFDSCLVLGNSLIFSLLVVESQHLADSFFVPTLGEICCRSLMLLSSALAKRHERLASQFISCDHEHAVGLRVRYINNTQIPAGTSLPQSDP